MANPRYGHRGGQAAAHKTLVAVEHIDGRRAYGVPIVLVVSDNSERRNELAAQLRDEGYLLLTAYDPVVAGEAIRHNPITLAIIDVSQSFNQAAEVCLALRQQGDPDIQLVALVDHDARRAELERAGVLVDEYLLAPLTWAHLRVRVRLLLHRTEHGKYPPSHLLNLRKLGADDERLLVAGPLRIDIERREITKGGELIDVRRARLFDLLIYLVRMRGKPASTGQLLTNVWGYLPTSDAKTVTVHMCELRKLIEDDPSHPMLIQTVRGVGYRFAPSESFEQLPPASAD